ncbi:MAG TPA: hypothetical protein VMT29_18730 [Steroidobacteraceae bacterium]|nr:hypothetical protein [Steroidobacteraceae bacterium]
MLQRQQPGPTPRSLRQSEFAGVAGAAREAITPPAGIYGRLWGSAKHDVAEGVHKPLLATCLYLSDVGGAHPVALLALDLSWWRSVSDEAELRSAVMQSTGLSESQLILHVSHSHAAPSTWTGLADRPGGHLIGAYRAHVTDACIRIVGAARAAARPVTLSWGTGSCRLAFNRDLPSPFDGSIVVGLNPARKADDTLLVGRVTDVSGAVVATLVNYACHPTSVGGGNRLISPDYVGAMRETVERETGGAPCLFLHGASGDLTPRRSFGPDIAAADLNGAELGHAALATLAAMYPAGTSLAYIGIEESGAKLATWAERPALSDKTITAVRSTVRLELVEMPTRDELHRAIAATTEEYMRERLRRKLGLRTVVDESGAADFPYVVWRLGEAFLVALPAEAHSPFQIDLRARFPERHIAVLNIANGYLSYLPPREAYEQNTYQAQVAIYKAGAAERVLEAVSRTIDNLLV